MNSNRFSSSYKEAGVRTHVLVALSTCLLMIISKYEAFSLMAMNAAFSPAEAFTSRLVRKPWKAEIPAFAAMMPNEKATAK